MAASASSTYASAYVSNTLTSLLENLHGSLNSAAVVGRIDPKAAAEALGQFIANLEPERFDVGMSIMFDSALSILAWIDSGMQAVLAQGNHVRPLIAALGDVFSMLGAMIEKLGPRMADHIFSIKVCLRSWCDAKRAAGRARRAQTLARLGLGCAYFVSRSATCG